jgi:hypothetical protein
VIDFQGILSAQDLSNPSPAQHFRGLAVGATQLPTKLSTQAVDCRPLDCRIATARRRGVLPGCAKRP